MNALIHILAFALGVMVVELVLLHLAKTNRVIEAVGNAWANIVYCLAIVYASHGLLDTIACIVGVGIGIALSIAIHMRSSSPTPLQFFTHLDGGKNQ